MRLNHPLLLLMMLFGVIQGVAVHAGTIAPHNLENLAEESIVIVIGHVTAVAADGENDQVVVHVIDRLKGSMEHDEFQLWLTPRGLVGFNVALTKGAVGVFFLKSIPSDESLYATLTAPHGVAILDRTAFSISK